MSEKAPPSFHVGVVVRHGILALLGSLASASYAPLPLPKFPPPSPVPPLMMLLPLLRLADSALRVGANIAAAAANVGVAEVSDVGHRAG